MLLAALNPYARCLLLSTPCLCFGCGATGLDWVGEAHLESASQQRAKGVYLASNQAPISTSVAAINEQSSVEPRPRLNHTVTLGAIDATAMHSDAGPQALPAPSVIVNNYNQVNLVTPAFGYANYGYFPVPGGFSPGHVAPHPAEPSVSGPLPGQNWPAVADHGPNFPYSTLPASPWTRTR